MSYWIIFVLLTTTMSISEARVEKDDYVATSELAKKEDKLLTLTHIVRGRNSSKGLYLNTNETEESDKRFDKMSRTALHRLESEFKDNCCGSRYGSSGSGRPDSYYDKISANGGRHPSQYGERFPVDRHGWQVQGQSLGSNGSSGRPGGWNHGGTSIYEGNEAGDRFSSRPNHGGESTRRPAGYESGGYGYGNGVYGGYTSGRPTGYGGLSGAGGYGISGTLANGDEFGSVDQNLPEGSVPQHPNIQAQKAVALKALAGVALIGAAAALATNPVLLPIGIVSGRKKRSSPFTTHEDLRMHDIFTDSKSNYIKVYDNGSKKNILVSPACVCKFACEFQKIYLQNHKNDGDISKRTKESERYLTDLLFNQTKVVDARVRKLIKAAFAIASRQGNCNIFTCTLVKSININKNNELKHRKQTTMDVQNA